MSTAEDFRAALEHGEFMINRCRRCSAASSPDVAACHTCGSPEIEWVAATGRATVISWSRIPQRPGQDGEDTLVVIAQLIEGPWCWAALANSDLNQLAVGAELRCTAGQSSSGATIPLFHLVDAQS